jgi:hypothetical protein
MIQYLILSVFMSSYVQPQNAASYIQPQTDECMKLPCQYQYTNLHLQRFSFFTYRLADVGEDDDIFCKVNDLFCRNQRKSCPVPLLSFASPEELRVLKKDRRRSHGSAPWETADQFSKDGVARHTVRGTYDFYYVVVWNNASAVETLTLDVTYRAASCAHSLLSLLLAPVILLSIFFISSIICLRSKGMKSYDYRQSCCAAPPSHDVTQPDFDDLEHSHLPNWQWVYGYPAKFYARPKVAYSKWWRTQVRDDGCAWCSYLLPCYLAYLLIYSLTHSLTHSLTYSLTHHTHSLTYSLTN